MGRIRPIGLMVMLALLGGASWAQESLHHEYYLGEQAEMSLDSHPDDAKTWSMEVRLYGDATEGVVFSVAGDLKQLSKDVYEYRSGTEKNPKVVRIIGRPIERTPMELTTRNLVYADTKPVHLHGTFKHVDPEYREAQTKERFQKADAALGDFVDRLAADIGKSTEPKLREAYADRLKYRDAVALQAIGGPSQPRSGLGYWQALYTVTLDSLAFFRSYTGRTATKTLPGSYRAANGSALELDTPPEGGLRFTVTIPLAPIAFGPDGEPRKEAEPPLTGQIVGVARLYGTRAVYKGERTRNDKGEAREPAEIVFTVRGHIVHLDAQHTEAFAGRDLFFSGDYFKTIPPPLRK